MAELIWTEPALSDLEAIADYIALDKPEAARLLVQRIFQHVEQLIEHPESGSRPRELSRSRYRQIIEPPCRIFYRYDGHRIVILHVMRSEMRLRKSSLLRKPRTNPPGA
jgi:toxin ParE1/3/4